MLILNKAVKYIFIWLYLFSTGRLIKLYYFSRLKFKASGMMHFLKKLVL